MSMLEPYDYSQFPSDDDEFSEPMQMHGGSSWQPGWRPPSQQRPPYGPPWPPGPGHGGWPFWGYWGFRLRSAWRDVKFLNKLIGDIVGEQIDNGIIAPGPNYVPPSGQTPTPTPGVKGVTDGSDAGPGQVGEFISATASFSYQGYPQATNSATLSPIVVQPGDWDLWAFMTFTTPIGGAAFWLSPQPTGISNNMGGQAYQTGAEVQYANIMGAKARGNFSVPTLLPFWYNVNNANIASIPAGTGQLYVQARRMR